MFMIRDDGVVRIQARNQPDPAHEKVLVSFTGVGHQMGDMDEQRPEFFTAGNAFDNILFISDLTRSWGNAFDLGEVLDGLSDHLQGREIYTLGNSMGGFLSILAARHLPVLACAAFVPQFSVNPEIMPREERWKRYTSRITGWRERSLEGQFNSTTRYCILSGAVPRDRRHWERFPVQDNITHVVPRPSSHELARELKEQGILQDILSAIWDGRFSADWLRDTSGKKVQSLSGPRKAVAARPGGVTGSTGANLGTP